MVYKLPKKKLKKFLSTLIEIKMVK